MLNNRYITVIIPVLNEEQSIGRVIRDVPDCVDRIVVVDNGSSDSSQTIALDAGAEVVNEPDTGYGRACQTGIQAAGKTDILAFLDGDYSDYPEDMVSLLEPLASGHCDITIGCRIAEAVLPRHQEWGNWLACQLIWLLHGVRYQDLGPMRCVSRVCLERLQMQDNSYGWTAEMQIRAARARLRILQVPVRYRPRIGHSKISGTLKGSLMAGYKILFWTLWLALFRKSGVKG